MRKSKTEKLYKDIFNKKQKKENFLGTVYEYIEYTCPICKSKFKEYIGSTHGILIHISKLAKSECVAKQLGEIKTTPHFEFWKKNTKPMETLYKKREWKII